MVKHQNSESRTRAEVRVRHSDRGAPRSRVNPGEDSSRKDERGPDFHEKVLRERIEVSRSCEGHTTEPGGLGGTGSQHPALLGSSCSVGGGFICIRSWCCF